MSTLILTGQFDSAWPVGLRTLPSKRDYCSRNGYALLEIHAWERRLFCWQKIFLADWYLNQFDVVAWMDSDSLITNAEVLIESFIEPGYCLFASQDWYKPDLLMATQRGEKRTYFSAGNIIFTRHPQRRKLFDSLYQIHANHPHLHEQDSLQMIARGKLPGHDLISVLPGSSLCAVPADFQPHTANPWDESCLLAHLTCLKDQPRLEWLDKHYPL